MKQLELAIDKYRQKDPTLCIEIHMHPFQLNGLITETPIKRQDFGERKFGKARWDAINASLVDKFKSVGIDFQTDSYMSSSHLAHRLAALCADKKPEEEVSLAMDFYDMHHVQGIHCSDKEALARIAVKHGLFNTEQEAVNWLNSSEYDLQVKKCYQKAQQNGITGVPFFVFQDKYAASGAMGVDEFVQVSLSHSRASGWSVDRAALNICPAEGIRSVRANRSHESGSRRPSTAAPSCAKLTLQILSEVSRREKSLSPPPLQVSGDTCAVNTHEDACHADDACHVEHAQTQPAAAAAV